MSRIYWLLGPVVRLKLIGLESGHEEVVRVGPRSCLSLMNWNYIHTSPSVLFTDCYRIRNVQNNQISIYILKNVWGSMSSSDTCSCNYEVWKMWSRAKQSCHLASPSRGLTWYKQAVWRGVRSNGALTWWGVGTNLSAERFYGDTLAGLVAIFILCPSTTSQIPSEQSQAVCTNGHEA